MGFCNWNTCIGLLVELVVQIAEYIMPKLKAHSGASKRFKKTGGGIKRRRAFRNHILTKKTTKQKRRLRVNALAVHESDKKSVDRMLAGS